MIHLKKHHPDRGLGKLCTLFGKSRQAFYDHAQRESRKLFNEGIIIASYKEFVKNNESDFGASTMLDILRPQLAEHQIYIGRDRFYSLMRDHNLLIKRRKKYAITTNSNHPYKKYPDLRSGLQVDGPNQLWVSDITYLRTWKGFAYLSLITDAYSHKVVGYHLSQSLKAQGCIIALDKALDSIADTEYKPVHHSDRGIQYCCDAYVKRLEDKAIAISMTQKGSPYENPVAERLNGILKHQLRLKRSFPSYSHAIAYVHKAIHVYNTIRPHLSIDRLTPQKAHLMSGKLKKRWKAKTYKPCQTP